MPPKKKNNNKGNGGGAAPSAEQLRAMGMSEDQINQMLALRKQETGMSDEDRKKQAAADDAKKQHEQRLRSLEKSEHTGREEVLKEEFNARGDVYFESEADYDVAHQKSSKRRIEEDRAAKKKHLEDMRVRREELQRKQAQERAEALETLEQLPEDVRQARIAEMNADIERKEREIKEAFEKEQAEREAAEKSHEEKEKARRDRMRALREEREKWGAVGTDGDAAAGAHSDDLHHEAGQAMLETKQTRNIS